MGDKGRGNHKGRGNRGGGGGGVTRKVGGHPCDPINPTPFTCISITRERNYFTVRPEKMMLKIEHAVVASRFHFRGSNHHMAASQRSMKGNLHDAEGKSIKRCGKKRSTGSPTTLGWGGMRGRAWGLGRRIERRLS